MAKLASDVDRFAAFRLKYCRHQKGPLAGKPVAMEQWQYEDWQLALRVNPKTGLRVFNDVVFLRCKKNTKSLDAADIGFYLLSPFDGELGPEGFSLAGDKEQARVVMKVAQGEADPKRPFHSAELARLFKVQRDRIYCERNGAEWRPVAHNADTVEGSDPHYVSVDEYHVHKTSELRENMKTAMVNREQPFMFTISTEGTNPNGPLARLRDAALELSNVEKPTPYKTIAWDEKAGFLFIKYGLDADSDADIEDPAVLNGCNPASWITPGKLLRILHDPGTTEAMFRIKHCNQAQKAGANRGIPAEMFDACHVDGLELPSGTEVCIGIDAGWRDDYTAVVAAGRLGERVAVEHHIFAPTDSQDVDLEEAIVDTIVEMSSRLRIREIAGDPSSIQSILQALQKRGFVVVEFYQSRKYKVPASITLWRALKSGRFAHDGDPVYREHHLNARMAEASTDWYFDKPLVAGTSSVDTDLKIDALVATYMAVHRLEAGEASVYETEGLLFL